MKYRVYWRKAGIKPEMGSRFLEIVNEKKPKNFLEIGVYTGVPVSMLETSVTYKANYLRVTLVTLESIYLKTTIPLMKRK